MCTLCAVIKLSTEISLWGNRGFTTLITVHCVVPGGHHCDWGIHQQEWTSSTLVSTSGTLFFGSRASDCTFVSFPTNNLQDLVDCSWIVSVLLCTRFQWEDTQQVCASKMVNRQFLTTFLTKHTSISSEARSLARKHFNLEDMKVWKEKWY